MMTYREFRAFRAVASVLLMGLAGRAAAQSTWYVARSGTGDGSSWASPTNSLQGAIDACTVGGTVWVGAGVYDTGGAKNFPTGSTLTNRVAIHKAITVSSTNANPALTVIRGAWHPVTTNGTAAVRGVYLAAGAKLIGFTVSGGATFAWGVSPTEGTHDGGGIWCADTTAIVSNCVISANTAAGRTTVFGGGGLYRGTAIACRIAGNESYVGGGANSSILTNCTLEANLVRSRGSSYPQGGGAYNCTLRNGCVVVANTNMVYFGGGLASCTVYGSIVSNNYVVAISFGGGAYGGTLYNSRVVRNHTAGRGGGVYNSTLYNCQVADNTCVASYGGGAQASWLYNCTVVRNRGGAGGVALQDCTVITNCIVQFNTNGNSQVANYNSGTAASAFGATCTTPAKAGWAAGNITDNPRFVDAAAGDYRLVKGSPCIDTGTNLGWMGVPTDARSGDLDGNPRVLNDTVDMGAYEFASFSGGTVILLR